MSLKGRLSGENAKAEGMGCPRPKHPKQSPKGRPQQCNWLALLFLDAFLGKTGVVGEENGGEHQQQTRGTNK